MSTVFDPVAQKLVDVINGIGATGAVTKAATGYKWGRVELDATPAGVVALPDFRRTGVEQKESQLGSNDWWLTYPVLLAVDLDEAVAAQGVVIDLLEAFIAAVDANPSLSNTVLDSKVTDGTPYIETHKGRPLVGYECHVEALKLTSL
jgi:hypothetical protein